MQKFKSVEDLVNQLRPDKPVYCIRKKSILSASNFFQKKFPGKIIGTSLKSNIDYKTADWKSPCVILMGNEQSGLSNKLGDACDQLITMPMRGRSDSLNLAVATGISLYEFLRHEAN